MDKNFSNAQRAEVLTQALPYIKDYNGKVLIKPKYESISRAAEYQDEDIYLIVMQNGKKGVIKKL